ncbi:hypothetical protein [Caballeronia zhejiangensis]|uniref:hypothetical protein n=1 Tax=Caballeronia zhejiangensis TaxID=871203 RepID=UPI001F5284F4|nr:hypothetical protein [Caballeronia zhejiangensis]MCI1041800.1 hypothetical protein [Caballeronia zhejiangensis]
MNTMNDDLHDEPEETDFDAIRAQVDADLHSNLHDDDEDDDDDLCWADVEYSVFTDRAMPHGRRAATWLLLGLVAEVAVIAGFDRIEPSLSKWLIVPGVLITLALMLSIVVLIHNRWTKHRARMESVIEDAMDWMAAAQRKELCAEDAHMRRHQAKVQARAEEERIEALREELTWYVGPPPVFIDANGCRHPTPDQVALEEHARREFGALFDSLEGLDGPDEQHDGDEGPDNVPTVPALPLQAWIQRWADMKPTKRPEPVFKRSLQRHSDTEGRRLERELCSAINKHWDGAFHRLIAEGANPNGHDDSGQPLRKAVLRGRLEHISWLLTLGADPNAQPFGRSILQAVMTQVEHFADEEERGDGDACEWPETLELLGRWGANPFIKNRYYDRGDETEGPTPWPQILKRPILYEAFMKGRNTWLQADQDAMRLLRDGRESVGLAEVADETRAMLDTFRSPGRA